MHTPFKQITALKCFFNNSKFNLHLFTKVERVNINMILRRGYYKNSQGKNRRKKKTKEPIFRILL